MRSRNIITYFIIIFSIIVINGCKKEGPAGAAGPAGQDSVFYSGWFQPLAWSGDSADWYFDASAPSLTTDIVENGVVLAYAWLAGDLYNGTAERPLPAFAVGADWSFLIYQYGSIQFECNASTIPGTNNYFRYVAIPANLLDQTSSKSEPLSKSFKGKSVSELKGMSYEEIIKLLNIPK